MNYETAKTNFETVVTRMQAELKEYANKPRASQAAIDARLANINQLVEFYKAAEELISEEQMRNTELQLALMKYHGNAQRLVHWCKLHRTNPDSIFFYTENELKELYDQGVRFGRVEDLYYSENEAQNKAQDKYIYAGLHTKKLDHSLKSTGGFSDEQIAMMYATCLYNFNNRPQPYAQ